MTNHSMDVNYTTTNDHSSAIDYITDHTMDHTSIIYSHPNYKTTNVYWYYVHYYDDSNS